MDAFCLQPSIPFGAIAVNFHTNFCNWAVKVQNVPTNPVPAPKLEAQRLSPQF